VEHLSQEELLLLADGELAVEREEHLDACAACRSAAGAVQGHLTAITAQLRAAAPEESPESHSASWNRLQTAIRGESAAISCHLEAEELLMQLDDELAPERALHLESCKICYGELLRVQALLFDIEHELRALIPAEPLERRRAAAAALDREIYAAPPKVISFPVRWGAVYAAAAALMFAVFGGLWSTQRPIAEPIAPEPMAEAPAPIVVPPVLIIEAEAVEAQQASAVTAAEPERSFEPERFELAEAGNATTPQPVALDGAGAVRIDPVAGETLGLPPALALAAPPVAAPRQPVGSAAAEDPNLLLAGLRAATRSGAWTMDVEPEIRGGRLTFVGEAASETERDELIAAVRRELSGDDIAFAITVADTHLPLASPPASDTLGARPGGGMMRTALLAHYGDAARRSFQQPTQSALDAEIARFAGAIYRSQSDLVRHAHALDGVLREFTGKDLSPESARSLDGLVRFHAKGVVAGEARIYDQLSEALPRKYWNHRGDRQALDGASPVEAGSALLADALYLDETLTTLLGSSAGSVDVGEVQTSAGALLYRIRARARYLTSGLDSGR
jgi:hypothetical protein